MKEGIVKDFPEVRVALTINGYIIHAFAWNQHDPNNIATARLEIVYSLARVASDGTIAPSPIPEHQGVRIALYDKGESKPLTEWLKHSGDPSDLLDWNYHDIERLVEIDISERFGYQVM